MGSSPLVKHIENEEAMLALGAKIAASLFPGMRVYLQGQLGAGKTTLCRGLLRGLGYIGPIKSPTYGIVEHYEINGLEFHHFDFYRICDPEECEYMGLRDYLSDEAIILVEWPEHVEKILPEASVYCKITVSSDNDGREVELTAFDRQGEILIQNLKGMSI